VLIQEIEDQLRLRSACAVLDPGVDIFGVLAKNSHIDRLGPLDRRGHALEIVYRPQANI
jgi:hypothetical protein